MIAVEVGVGLNACAGSAVFVAASKPLPIQAPLRSAERPVQRSPRSGSYCQSKEALARRWGILSNLASISAGPIWRPPRLVDQVLSIVRLFRSRVDDEDKLVTDPDQLNSASLKASDSSRSRAASASRRVEKASRIGMFTMPPSL